MLSNLIDLDDLADAVSAAGLDSFEISCIASRLRDTLTRLRTQRAKLTNDAAAATDRLARLIAGDLSLEDALTADVLGLETPEGKARVAALAERGMDHARRLAAQDLRPLVPDLFEDLADLDRTLLAEATELAAKVEGIDDDGAAMAATPAAREAWVRLVDIVQARKNLEEVVKILRNAQVLPDVDRRRVVSAFLRFRFPERQPDGLARLHPVRQLLGRIDAGAEPGLYSAEEATAWQEDADRENR